MLAWESYHRALGWLNAHQRHCRDRILQRFVETGLITAGFADRDAITGMAGVERGERREFWRGGWLYRRARMSLLLSPGKLARQDHPDPNRRDDQTRIAGNEP